MRIRSNKKVKCTVAGNIGTGYQSVSVNNLENREEVPSPRLAAFIRAFLAANVPAWEALENCIKREIGSLDEAALGLNGKDHNVPQIKMVTI